MANDESYSINSIKVEVQKKQDNEGQNSTENKNLINEIQKVEKVEIGEVDIDENENSNNIVEEEKNTANNDLSNSDKKKLKEYLSSVYEVNEDNITIN